jgi:membrane protein
MSLWRALRRFLKGDGLIFSGYLAFLSLLALLPALGVLFWLSQQSTIIRTADAAFRDFLFTNLFPDTAKQVVAVVEKLRANARGLGITGITIIAGDLLLKALALSAAVDRIWGVTKRSVWGFVRGAFIVLLVVPVVMGVLFWLIRFVEKFLAALMPTLRSPIETFFDPFEIGVPLIAALTLIYRWVPTRLNTWASPLASAILVTLLIEIARYVIVTYFAQMDQLKSLYGAFIAFPVLMVTLFVLWVLVLYGAALVAEGFGSALRWPKLTNTPKAGRANAGSPRTKSTVAGQK